MEYLNGHILVYTGTVLLQLSALWLAADLCRSSRQKWPWLLFLVVLVLVVSQSAWALLHLLFSRRAITVPEFTLNLITLTASLALVAGLVAFSRIYRQSSQSQELLRRRLQEERTLSTLLDALNRLTDVEALCEKVLEAVSVLLQPRAAWIYRRVRGSGHLIPYPSRVNFAGEEFALPSLPLSQGWEERLGRFRAPAVFDASLDPEHVLCPVLDAHRLGQVCVLTLHCGEKVLGYLFIAWPIESRPELPDTGLLSTLGAMVGSAWNRLEMVGQERDLARLAGRLSEATGAQEIAAVAMDEAVRLFDCEGFFIDYFDESHHQLVGLLYMDTIQGVRQRVEPVTASTPSFASRVLEGKPFLINRRFPEDEPALNRFGDRNRPALSLLFAPVRREGRPVGLISIQSYTRLAYNESDLSFLQMFADHCGGALVNARLAETSRYNALRYQALVEQSSTPILYMQGGKICFCNQAALNLFGVKNPDELVGTDGLSRIVPEHRSRAKERIQKRLRGEPLQPDVELEILRNDGTRRAILIQTSEILLGGERTVQLVCQDITHRKKAEAALQARLEELDLLYHCSHQLAGSLQLRDIIPALFAELERIMPVDAGSILLCDNPDKLEGTDLYTFDTREDGTKISHFEPRTIPLRPHTLTMRAMRTRQPQVIHRTHEEVERIGTTSAREGFTRRPASSLAFLPLCKGDQLLGVLSVQSYESNCYGPQQVLLLTSVADQLALAIHNARLFEQVRDSNRMLSSILAAATNLGLITISPHLSIETFSPGAENLFGYRAPEVQGQPVQGLFPSGQEELLQEWLRTVCQERHVVEVRTTLVRKGGEVFPADWALYPIWGEGNQLSALLATVQDVTEEVNREKALRQAWDFNEAILNTVNAVIVGVNPEGRVALINETVAGY